MKSALYVGRLRHRRVAPTAHEFRYSVFQVYLDLSELDEVFRGRWFWSAHRPALARFRRADHVGDPTQPLDATVRTLVETASGRRPAGPIRLLTHLRYFGYGMNPASFFYCFDRHDTKVESIVAEVNNTPWGERHCYVLTGAAGSHVKRYAFHKAFHVSPFMPMDMAYQWRFTDPGTRLTVHMINTASGQRVFDATLALERRPMSTWQLARVLVAYPFMTAQVVVGIYWQAFRLWWKGVPYHPRPRQGRTGPRPDTATERTT